jgi:hypothetical protein
MKRNIFVRASKVPQIHTRIVDHLWWLLRMGGKCRKCHPCADELMQCRNSKQFKLFCRILDEVGHYNEWGYDCE